MNDKHSWIFRSVKEHERGEYDFFARRWYCPYCKRMQTYGETPYCPYCGKRIEGVKLND